MEMNVTITKILCIIYLKNNRIWLPPIHEQYAKLIWEFFERNSKENFYLFSMDSVPPLLALIRT